MRSSNTEFEQSKAYLCSNYSKDTKMKLTLVIKKGKNGFLIGQLKELPAVFTQGLTLEEVRENIVDSLELYLEDIREQYLPEGDMLREEELTFA
jgi:predicted RNase H-like HicB family nuclease